MTQLPGHRKQGRGIGCTFAVAFLLAIAATTLIRSSVDGLVVLGVFAFWCGAFFTLAFLLLLINDARITFVPNARPIFGTLLACLHLVTGLVAFVREIAPKSEAGTLPPSTPQPSSALQKGKTRGVAVAGFAFVGLSQWFNGPRAWAMLEQWVRATPPGVANSNGAEQQGKAEKPSLTPPMGTTGQREKSEPTDVPTTFNRHQRQTLRIQGEKAAKVQVRIDHQLIGTVDLVDGRVTFRPETICWPAGHFQLDLTPINGSRPNYSYSCYGEIDEDLKSIKSRYLFNSESTRGRWTKAGLAIGTNSVTTVPILGGKGLQDEEMWLTLSKLISTEEHVEIVVNDVKLRISSDPTRVRFYRGDVNYPLTWMGSRQDLVQAIREKRFGLKIWGDQISVTSKKGFTVLSAVVDRNEATRSLEFISTRPNVIERIRITALEQG